MGSDISHCYPGPEILFHFILMIDLQKHFLCIYSLSYKSQVFSYLLVHRSHKYVFVQASHILYMAIAVVAVFWNAFPSLLFFITFKSHTRKFFLIYFLYDCGPISSTWSSLGAQLHFHQYMGKHSVFQNDMQVGSRTTVSCKV